MSDNKKESRFLRNIHPLLKRGRRTDKPGNDSNFALLTAIDESLKDVEGEALNAKLYTALSTAPGEYLDVYGRYFGIKRNNREIDDSYRKRIIEKIDIPRGTNDALEFATKRYLGNPNLAIQIDEYWRKVFTLNKSLLNGPDRFLGDTYNVAVIDIRIGSPFPIGLVEELEKFKPAGVTMYLTYDPSLSSGEVPGSRVLPYMEYNLEHSTLAMSENGLNKFFVGSLKMSDKSISSGDNPFILNQSLLNSLDTLGDGYSIHNNKVNYLGLGFNSINPKENDLAERLYAQQRPVAVDMEQRLDSFGKDSVTVDINSSQSLYLTFDMEKHSRYKYGEIDYSLLNHSELVIRSKESRDRVQYTQEVFNFTSGKWEVQYQGYTSHEFSVKSFKLGQAEHYVNNNGIITFRLVPLSRVSVELDYLSFDYKYETDYVTSHNYGYSARNLPQTIKYPPVITNYLVNGLNNKIVGDIKLTDKVARRGKDTFVLNQSELNSLDVLGTYYNFELGNYSYIGTMDSLESKKNVLENSQTTIETAYSLQDIVPEEDIVHDFEISSTSDKDIYFSFDVRKYLTTKHGGLVESPNIPEMLDGSTFSLLSRENTEGVNFKLEAFNFKDGIWETLEEGKTSTEISEKSFTFGKGSYYVNDNGLLLVRLVSDDAVTHTMTDLIIRYSYALDTPRDSNYGFRAKNILETIEIG